MRCLEALCTPLRMIGILLLTMAVRSADPPHPEGRAERGVSKARGARRLEGWAATDRASWFETRLALLTMRRERDASILRQREFVEILLIAVLDVDLHGREDANDPVVEADGEHEIGQALMIEVAAQLGEGLVGDC